MNQEKLKVLIKGLKASNEVMKKQIEIHQRTIDLLGDLIIEPERVKPTNIKPEDMVSGNWYVLETIDSFLFTFKFKSIVFDNIKYYDGYNHESNEYCYCGGICKVIEIYSIRKATREEVTKYFPHEYEINTHGLNDVPNIPQVTDEQL